MLKRLHPIALILIIFYGCVMIGCLLAYNMRGRLDANGNIVKPSHTQSAVGRN